MKAKQDNMPAVKADTKRTKANYDIVKGQLLGHIKTNPGITLNGLNEHFGVEGKAGTNYKFPVIYQGVRQLMSAGTIHGTGAKKNQGLYTDKATAEKNKPEPVVRTPRKKDSPFVLEKQMKDNKWRAIEGNTEKAPIVEAYKTASSVPGSVFRVTDNTGKEPKVIMTNEPPVEPTAPAKTTKTTKTEPVKV